WLSYACGFIFFILILYWLAHITLVGLILFCLYLALYFGFFGYFFTGFKIRHARTDIYLIIFLSCVWVILEYLRSNLLSGFPWAILGYSQYQNIKIIQFADIAGGFGLSFLVIFVNLCLFAVIKILYARDFKALFKFALILSATFIAVYAYGSYSINKYSRNDEAVLKVSLIQANIPQEEKWSSFHKEKIKIDYLDLSVKAAEDAPDIIIWPETSYPEYIIEGDAESIVPMLAAQYHVGVPILFGAVYQKEGSYFNSAILLKDISVSPQIYKKIHLVPFGEYLPLRKLFFFLEPFVPIGDFSSGSEFFIFDVENKNKEPVRFGVLICFEDTIAQLSRQFVLRGADFLVNITNDAWFKKTSSPYQHLQASVFRAVENRVCLIRAANTGVTCVIDNRGKIIKRLGGNQGTDIFVKGFITEEVSKSFQDINMGGREEYPLTFYSRYGDLFVFCCGLYMVLFVFGYIFAKRKYA
ncbi:MAG: apolipoprotein N-acyltransferase, partial [Candidatus Omnitrophica bacterium]|nr:apolipoprotein N-acyltransferase [Candidatus Omnitrophota bacterium]